MTTQPTTDAPMVRDAADCGEEERMSEQRNTNFEERLAVVLFDATSGMRSDVSWDDCAGKGLWLADAARILGEYQQAFLAIIADAEPNA